MTPPVVHTGAGDFTVATDPSNGNITCGKPPNTSSGDVLIAVLNSTIASTWDIVPEGWTQGAIVNTTRTTSVFYKAIPSAAAETATDYHWHLAGGAGRIGALIFRATGVDGEDPIDAVGAGGAGTAAIVDPAVIAESAEAVLLAVFCSYIASGSPTAITKPNGMTNVGGWSVTTGTNSTTCLVTYETLAAAGDSGTRTAAVAPAGANGTGLMVTLKPGTVAQPPPAPVAHFGADDVSTVAVSSSPLLRVPKPPATTDGDLLVGVLQHRNSGPVFSTVPPGWTPWPVAYNANGILAAYWKRVDDAAGEPDVYTWRSPNGSARGAAVVFRVTGAAAPGPEGGPVDSVGAATGAGTDSITAPPVDISAPAALLLACFATTASNTTPPAVTAPDGMQEVAAVPVVTGSASAFLQVSALELMASGSSGARTAAVSPSAGSAAGFLLAVAPPGYGTAQPPQLLGRLTGGVTAEAARVTAVTKFAGSVRFACSMSPDLSSPTFTPSVVPDRDGIAAGEFSGLSADTVYHWAVELDGALNIVDVSRFRTLPDAGAPASFSFAAGSCADTNSNAASFADAAARVGPTGAPPLFVAHLGDMHYQDIGADDRAWVLAAWLNAIGQPNQQALYGAAPLAYTWSDHDFGGPNVAASSPAAPAVQSVYRRLFPSHPLPGDGVGIYQSWQVGRVRFILTDGRSYMDPITAPDNADKSKLGPVQKAWWKEQVTAPGAGLVVWLHEDGWHNASTFGGDDTWSAYATERRELADYITEHQVPLLYVHGDVHALSYDDGSHVPGRFPLISVSPWDQTTFIGNGGLTGGVVPTPQSPSVKAQQYAWFDVLDDGAQILVRYLGVSGGQVVQRMDFSWGIDRRTGWGVPT
ncbi:alkaline phosphatase D family protein [Actinomadura opuntiae]|uniref:alkaline phosphatase D family protein n=1 Tax=Actinomadura sp. OS1-43 TaxID=604315 RepID=UPI00255AB9B2|nr:alkaline phosphatase D family protein [Actinomadura sp. OS1-43]MDL4812826.1 alkaline phosphatase D family protein [Actinomadura sp. OS1-43]